MNISNDAMMHGHSFDQKGNGQPDNDAAQIRLAAFEQAKLWRDRAIKHCLRQNYFDVLMCTNRSSKLVE